MNEMANLLLGMVTPGMTASGSLQPGSQTIAEGAAGTAFQDILMETLGGAAQKTEAEVTWAGQQASEATADEPTSGEGTDASASGIDSLLGSMSVAANLVGAVAVTPSEVTPQPDYATAEVPAVDGATTLSQAAPAASTEVAPVATDQAAPAAQTQNAATTSVGEPSELAAEAVTAPATKPESPAIGESQALGQNTTSQTVTASAAEADLQPAQAAQVGPAEQTGQAVETPDAADGKAVTHTNPNAKGQSSDVQDTRTQGTHTPPSDAVFSNSALPEVPAPVTDGAALDYEKLRLRLKLDVDVKSDGRVRLKESAMLSVNPQADVVAGNVPVAVKTNVTQGDLTIGKVDITPEGALGTQDISPVMVPVEKTTCGKQDTAQNSSESGFASVLSDISPSFEKSVNGAEKSQGFHAPERVVEQKLISQIVQSAKVHIMDGGANMTLRLDPPHLGVLQMSVSVQQGSVVANLQTSTEAARQVLQADLQSLRQALADVGMTVDAINISMNSSPDQAGTPYSDHHTGSRGSHSNSRFAQELFGASPEPTVIRSRVHQVTGGFDYLA